MVNETLQSLPETVTKHQIGRIDLPVVTGAQINNDPTFETLLNTLNRPDSESERGRIVSNLNNNSTTSETVLRHDRPVSAYFTLDKITGMIIIEWGSIDDNTSIAKLHDHLNRHINYQARVREGMRLSSGHLASLQEHEGSIALIDELYNSPRQIVKGSEEGILINTLYANRIYPVTPEGFLQLPAF